MRSMLSFFVLGAALLLAKVQWQKGAHAEKPRVLVEVASNANAATVANAIERAVLCEHAISLGAAYTDPVVQKELLSAVPPEAEGESTRARIERALLLGVHRAAPLVCERLAFQARQTLPLEISEPDADVLERYLREHTSRYREPARVDGIQIYVSAERHGARVSEVAAKRLAEAQALDPVRALELADPSLLPSQLASMTGAELDQRFGPGFGSAVLALEPGTLSPPLPSRFGLHLVRLDARRPEHVPAWKEIRDRLRNDYLLDARAVAEREAVRSLCASYRVELRRGAP